MSRWPGYEERQAQVRKLAAEDKSYGEIAAAVGLTRHGVYQMAKRKRIKIRKRGDSRHEPASQPGTAGAPDALAAVSPQLAAPLSSDRGAAFLGENALPTRQLDYLAARGVTPTQGEYARAARDRFGAMTIDGRPIRFPSYVPRVPWNEGNAIRNSAIFKQRAATLRASAGVSNVYDFRTV